MLILYVMCIDGMESTCLHVSCFRMRYLHSAKQAGGGGCCAVLWWLLSAQRLGVLCCAVLWLVHVCIEMVKADVPEDTTVDYMCPAVLCCALW
jgi:hypothetical protein